MMKYNPYSTSKAECYLQCPKKFDFKYKQKIKIPFISNLALLKGSYIHKVIEENFNYNTEYSINDIFTKEEREKADLIILNFENSIIGKELKTKTLINEEQFGIKIVNSNIVLADYNDPDVWYRGAIDAYFIEDIIHCIDYKSGKDKADDEEFGINQSKIYAIYLFLKYPNINVIKSRFLFVEHNTEKTIIYKRELIPSYVKDFYKTTKIIENDSSDRKVVTALCDYCDFFIHNHCDAEDDIANDFMNSKIVF